MLRPILLLFAVMAFALIIACGQDPELEPRLVTPTPVPDQPTATPTPALAPTSIPPDAVPTPAPADATAVTATPLPYDPYFVPDLCRIREPRGVIMQCGNLVVPENRTDPDSRMIEIHVIVIGTTSSNPAPDPLLYLSGGPGSSIVETATFQLSLFEHFLAERDVIVFDQRGVGTSEPVLDCPEDTQVVFETLNQHLTEEERKRIQVEAMRACRDRLVQEGVDLTGYNTAENAADVRDLRNALGIPEWNIYGVSYGTRLAMATMRDHPEGIRSVILDSAFPPDVDFYPSIVPNAERAFGKLFDECAANPTCSGAYPDLESKLYEVAALLDENPGRTTVLNPFTRQTHEVVVTGDRLVDTVFNALYVKDFIPLLPELIYDAGEYEFDTFEIIFGTILGQIDFGSTGMYFSVNCADEAPFSSQERVEASSRLHPRLAPFLEPDTLFDVCSFWGTNATPGLKEGGIPGHIPTLILAGEFDPITPPEWGRRAASVLAAGHLVEFPSAAHGVVNSSGCSLDITLEFLRSPDEQPDDSCVAELPLLGFKTPPAFGATLIPFEDRELGIRSVAPAGWIKFGPGIYGESYRGTTSIIQQAVPTDTAPQVLPAFTQQFGITIPQEPTQTLQLDGVNWEVYRLSHAERSTAIAISGDDEGMTFFLMLNSDAEEHDALYRNVFLPTLAELEILQVQ